MPTPTIRVVSFGFLHAAPPEAHIVIDVRTHFRDPHIAPEMRALTSSDPRVREHVLNTPGVAPLINGVVASVDAMTSGPAKADVTVAVGCAGGRHRAPTIAQAIADRLNATHTPLHLDKPVVRR